MSAPSPEPQPEPAPAEGDWQPLPSRARWLFVAGSVFGHGLVALALLVPIGLLLESSIGLPLALALLVALPALGAWLGLRRHACTRWRLDGDGYALRRGRLWRHETFVPRSRVQHLDIQHGPIERRFKLATLVIHTAGSRNSAVATAGLDAQDAERLRDHLARWIEHDDDDT